MPSFNVAYAITTPESAEYGEHAEAGTLAEHISLREAIDLCGGVRAYYQADCWPISKQHPPRWFYAPEYSEDYTTGEREERSFHIPSHVTAASRLRIARLLGVIKN